MGCGIDVGKGFRNSYYKCTESIKDVDVRRGFWK